MCGGTLLRPRIAALAQGLSPRVRGNPAVLLPLPLRPRSIPACAGEPTRTASTAGSCAVYPRVCGGTMEFAMGIAVGFGLSPRVRGNLRPSVRASPAPRSIPACAGEPLSSVSTHWGARVYPRVCGGTSTVSTIPVARIGLSPRVRGNLYLALSRLGRRRSIPACAGEPTAHPRESYNLWVYPRVCGGTRPQMRLGGSLPGLSPRVRGNHHIDLLCCVPMRSIPACAGEPIPSQTTGSPRRVYPRVCGGTWEPNEQTLVVRGLSPRVRGNRPLTMPHPNGPRSIPACAGEPLGDWMK